MDSKNLYWVGPRLSDIKGAENLFKGAVVLFGSSQDKDFVVYSYEEVTNKRINHNLESNILESSTFITGSILKIIKYDSNAFFMFYNDNNIPTNKEILNRSIYNDNTLLNLLSDKFKIRSLLSPIINVLNSDIYFTKDISYEFLKNKYNHDSFIIQTLRGAGGHSTFYLFSEHDEFILNKIDDLECIVSIFINQSVPVNINIIISNESIKIFPPSIQIIETKNNNMLYSGADYISFNNIVNKEKKEKLLKKSIIIAEKMKKLNYKGILGIDFLIKDNKIIFIEINPRFQASSFILNEYLASKKLPSIHEMHLMTHTNTSILDINIDFFDQINKSFFSILYSENTNTNVIDKKTYTFNTPDVRESKFNQSKMDLEIIDNNFNKNYDIEENSILSYLIFDFSLVYKNIVTKELEIIEHIQRLTINRVNNFLNLQKIDTNKIALLKFELLTYGAQLSLKTTEKLYSERSFLTIRDGIAGGLEIVLFDNIHINVPIKEKFTFVSPYTIDYDNNQFFLICENEIVIDLEVLSLPIFVNEKTTSGRDFIEVGQRMNDRLGLYPFVGCRNYKKNACKFCEVGYFTNFRINTIQDTLELIQYSLDNDVNMKHILISGGTPFDNNWEYFLEILIEIRKITNMNIYQMLEPTSKELIFNLHKNGLNEIGFNLEIYDRQIAKELMPQKGAIPLSEYIDCLEYAVSLWGKNGNVRSILIVGLESIESTLKGVEMLAKMGVMPILSPFRPVEHTDLENYSPPSADLLYLVWKKAKEIVEKYNIVLGPTCIACQNNTIALPIDKQYKYY